MLRVCKFDKFLKDLMNAFLVVGAIVGFVFGGLVLGGLVGLVLDGLQHYIKLLKILTIKGLKV